MLRHKDIWDAIDRLAEKNGFSASGLAIRSGLSSTTFNPSKRMLDGRKRWPSTESIASILQATDTDLDEFIEMVMSGGGEGPSRKRLPLIRIKDMGKGRVFDDSGQPMGKAWDEIPFPGLTDPRAFMLEIDTKNLEPFYREGDRIVISPVAKPRRGDRIALRMKKGNVVIATLIRETASQIEIETLNESSKPVFIPAEDTEWMHRIIWASQ